MTSIQERAVALARQRAEALAAQLKTAPNFQAAAKAAGLEAVTTRPDRSRRGHPEHRPQSRDRNRGVLVSGGHGQRRHLDADGRGDREGGLDGWTSAPADFAMARDKFRGELLGERRARFYQAYMEKARERMKIEIDPEALKRAVG